MLKATVTTGSYQKDGQEKNRWLDLGVAHKTKSGYLLVLDAVPAPVFNKEKNKFEWVINLFEQQSQGGGQKPAKELEDSIPF